MNNGRAQELHRLAPFLMWPGILVGMPALIALWCFQHDSMGTIGDGVVALLLLLVYCAGWLWTLFLGVPAALYSLHVERNAPHPPPAHSVVRRCVAVTFLSILTVLHILIALVTDGAA